MRTLLEVFGSSEKSRCGYCKGQNSAKNEDQAPDTEDESDESTEKSVSSGSAWAHSLSVNDYVALLDMGWRRSGRYLYKPSNRVTCCPQYTIRLDVDKFKMSRSQKRAMRQMNEFLATGKRPVCSVKEEDLPTIRSAEAKTEASEPSAIKNSGEPAPKRHKDMDRPVLTKKEIRNRRFEEKCRQRNVDPEIVRSERRKKEESRQRTIQSFIDEARPDWKHKLEVKLVNIEDPEFETRDAESFELYKKYQTTIHNDNDCRLAGFRRFLCDSPLKTEERNGVELGSFHLWFLLDDKLIAVCVVDVLPRCFSAKYMYYDPDYSFLSMGTYTALREIEQTQRLHENCPELQYYYMGYYIHSCPKMRYKAKFRPSDLLCDQSLQWLEYENCRPLLDTSTSANGFSEFRPDVQRPESPDFTRFLVMSDGEIKTFEKALRDLPESAQNEELLEKARGIAHNIGNDLGLVIYWFSELNE